MHVAEEIERQYLMERDAVEASPVIVGMRHDCSCGDLHQQDSNNDQEILADLALACRQRAKPSEHRIHRRIIGMIEPEFVDEQHKSECQEGEAEAGPGPDEGVRCRRIPDLWLVWPVLGPRPACIGPGGNGGQPPIDSKPCRGYL